MALSLSLSLSLSQARNVEQKREWALQLKRVILENYDAVIPQHARQLVLQLGQERPCQPACKPARTASQSSVRNPTPHRPSFL